MKVVDKDKTAKETSALSVLSKLNTTLGQADESNPNKGVDDSRLAIRLGRSVIEKGAPRTQTEDQRR